MEVQEAEAAVLAAAPAVEDSEEAASAEARVPAEWVVHVRVDSDARAPVEWVVPVPEALAVRTVHRIVPLVITAPISVRCGTVRTIMAAAEADVSAR